MNDTHVTAENEGYFSHPNIVSDVIMRREYQEKIATKALQRSTLVVLPTGLGKTIVALILIAERLKQEKGPVLMIAPTKPLVEQHRQFMEEKLKDIDVVMLTGEIGPGKRKEEYKKGQIVISTPQVVKNDIITGDLDISMFRTLIVDEAHRAVGDYPYVFIAEMFYEKRPDGLTLGLTASPGHDVSRIYDVCKNLGMESIEVRVDSDPDVKPYLQEMEVQRIKVELSDGMRSIIRILERMYLDRVSKLQRMGVLRRGQKTSIRELLGAAGRIQEMIRKAGKEGGAYYQAMSIQAQALKVSHALELAETQGAEALYQYLDRLLKETSKGDCSKATKNVVSDPLYSMVMNRVEALRGEVPSKVIALERAVIQKIREEPDARIIAFTHFRDTSSTVHLRLNALKDKGVRPVRFVGHASRGDDQGLNQREQKEVLDKFRNGEFNVLIATSVAEEGLDIPGADLVIFYEPIPSEIRTIQRRGRTGRHSSGKVIVLLSKETRDVAYSFSARDKELKMERQLMALRRMLSKMELPKKNTFFKHRQEKNKSTLDAFTEEEVKGEMIADQREMSSAVVEELLRIGVKVLPAPLGQGDYKISERILIERKTVTDLSDSLIDGRLFEQAKRLRNSCEMPMVLIEGDDIFSRRNINRNALFGALATLALNFNIPLMFTRSPKETAEFMEVVRRREEKAGLSNKRTTPRNDRSPDPRVLVLSGFPGISRITAEKLIEKFGSLERIFGATEEEFMEVEGIGPSKAKELSGLIKLGN